MDTDSVFSKSDLSGKWGEIEDAYDGHEAEHSIPFKVDLKARGDLAMFRAKIYLMKGKDGGFGEYYKENGTIKQREGAIARHGWNYLVGDLKRLFDGDVTELVTRKDVKHTLLTRERRARTLEFGRWESVPIKLELGSINEGMTIKYLLRADAKRDRKTFDSYGLIMEGKRCKSKAWSLDKLYSLPHPHLLEYPII